MLLISKAEFAILITVCIVAAACLVGIVVLSIWLVNKLKAKKEKEGGAQVSEARDSAEAAETENARDAQDVQGDEAQDDQVQDDQEIQEEAI